MKGKQFKKKDLIQNIFLNKYLPQHNENAVKSQIHN